MGIFGLLVLMAVVAMVGAVLIGGGLVWHESYFYGKLAFHQKPALDVGVHMGVEGQDFFRMALRELRMALDRERYEDAAGWVRAARRRGWWLAETAAASEESKELGTVMRQLAARRAKVENHVINVEDTGLVGSLNASH